MHTETSTPSAPSIPQAPARRRLLAAAPLAALLAACGGGGDAGSPGNAPRINAFSLQTPPVRVGESARLRVDFSGGSGRIEPGIGAVTSGSVVQTPVLTAPQRYRLVVTAPGQPEAVRELAVDVVWRDRLQAFDTPALVGHGVVAARDGTALVIAGSRGEGVLSAAIDRFDPATRQFTRLGLLTTGRSELSAVPLDEGRVLVFGGNTASVQPPFAELIDTRPGATLVSPAGWMMLPRSRHAALRLADGRVAAVGGSNRNSLELWDPATRSWDFAGNRMAHTREHLTATLLPDGKVLIVGGYTPAANYVFAEVFDPANHSFTPVEGAPAERRWLHAAFTSSDGSVLIVGGENDDGALASVWRYDPAARRFIAQTPLDAPRSVVRGAITPADEVLLYGGEAVAEQGLAIGVAWRAGVRRRLPDLPGPRAWHSVTRLADGRVLVLGGQHQLGYVTQGVLFD